MNGETVPGGLNYATDHGPGLSRKPTRSGRMRYFTPGGEIVTDETTLERARALAIPPAWTDVWISPDPHGHIQATGRDQRGLK